MMGFEEVVFVCFADIGTVRTKAIVQAQAMAALASDPKSSFNTGERLQIINDNDALVRELLSKHKDVLISAGFREERGDKIFLSDRPFEPGVSIGYRIGHWEQAEPKPEVEEPLTKDTTGPQVNKRKFIRHKSRRSPSL